MQFTHLHVHSEYSLLDGACRIKQLPKKAKELGMTSLAITDHGAMFGVIDFYKECISNGIKPIIGCEVYVTEHGKSYLEKTVDDKKNNHLILLAKDNIGYKNLCKIVSKSYVEGYYYKPRCDFSLIEKYSKGLVCLSGCLSGALSCEILYGSYDRAKQIASEYKRVFGDDYYIEIQNNGIAEQTKVNIKLIKLARELGIGLVATNDVHYLEKEDAFLQEILMCIQTGKRISDPNHMSLNTDQLYLKSPQEMEQYFANIPEAIENTQIIANKCNVTFEFGNTILPNYDVPPQYSSHLEYLKHLCHEGLIKRYGKIDEKIKQRAEYEIDVISKMGYVDYYLIVWDFINYAKSQGIPVGPGRGSGAGSLLAYAIGITDVDPLKYGLIFERFLNPERISMPDFDVDFCYERRQEVIDYVARKYGQEHVCQIITFGTMAARMVIRDIARVLDLPYSLADKVAKTIPKGPKVTIDEALKISPELKILYEQDQQVKQIIDLAKKLEGMPRNTSTHACGIIITKESVDSYVPLYARDGLISTQYIMTTLEELGLLKMDFLGLRTLTVISDTQKQVKEKYGIDIDYGNYDDAQVYKLWQDGNSKGIFQFESYGMTQFMKELKPDCLEDLIAGVSLYRPGPMDQIPQYIEAKKDKSKIKYLHPSLESILDVTYGCMVYQEQVMEIVRKLAGYSYGRADLVRRAMGKKKIDVMNKERQIFINGLVEDGKVIIPGCIRNGIDEESANKIFDEMAEFAKYAFNKSHAACYAVVAYQTAYLKKYYSAEFMAELLNSYIGNLDKVPEYVEECKHLGINILRPDINISKTKFFAKDNNIYYGLGSIKNVGTSLMEKIVADREKNGQFRSYIDFVKRAVKLGSNKKHIESLIKVGALDCFDKNRNTYLASNELIVDQIMQSQKMQDLNQVSIFEQVDQKDDIAYTFIEKEEMSDIEKLKFEKELLGIYVTGHPLDKYKTKLLLKSNFTTKQIRDEENLDDKRVKMARILSKVNKRYTKNNKLLIRCELEDYYGSVDVLAFEKCYLNCGKDIFDDNIVIVDGFLKAKIEEKPILFSNSIISINATKRQCIQIDVTNLEKDKRDKIKTFIKYFSNINGFPVLVNDDGNIIPCGTICLDNVVKSHLQDITNDFSFIEV